MAVLLAWGAAPELARASVLIEQGVVMNPLQQVSMRLPELLSDRPPSGLSHQVLGELKVSYRIAAGARGGSVLAVDIENTSRQGVGHYVLFVGDHQVAQEGAVHRLSADVEIEGNEFRGGVAAGFHLLGPQGDYWGEVAPPSGRADVFRAGKQLIRADWVGGTEFDRRGQSPARIFPRIAVQNIPARGKLTLRVHRLVLEKGKLPSWGVMPLASTVQAQPGGLFAAQVRVVADRVNPAGVNASLMLVDSKGVTIFQRSRAAPAPWKKSAGLLHDPWQVRLPALPADVEEETYQVLYGLQSAADGKPLRLAALAAGVTAASAGDGSLVTLGSVRVSRKGGVWMGATFHHYPASGLGDSRSSLGAIRMKHAFSRSFGNDHLMLPWWSLRGGGVHHDWERFDRWSAAFSEKNSKSLLLVMTGSPTSASRLPERRDNPFGAAGLAAIPRDLQNLSAVVEQTVLRYRDRLFAVECWNEPDVPGFYVGSRTELADHCKAVYQAVKKVAAQVPVLCPQVSTPENLGFVLGAQTSDGRPITQYCDWVGAHIYRGLARDAQSRPYAAESLAEELALLRARLASYGVDKPLAITEFGIDRCMTHAAAGRPALDQMSDELKADAIHGSLATLVEHGVRMIGLYSYDLGDDANPCSRGGYLWTTNPAVTRMNETVLRRINDAFSDFSATVPPW